MSYEDVLVDNCAMQLVRDPGQFDVVVTENMFGDILSDGIGAVLCPAEQPAEPIDHCTHAAGEKSEQITYPAHHNAECIGDYPQHRRNVVQHRHDHAGQHRTRRFDERGHHRQDIFYDLQAEPNYRL